MNNPDNLIHPSSPKILPASDPAWREPCFATLDRAGLVAVPTETVYGIIARADLPEAVERLYRVKGRDENKPCALFVADWKTLCPQYVPENPLASMLVEAFWPGPLTIVVNAHEHCPAIANGKVGARSPSHPLIQELLAHYTGPLINTSLNRSGEPPAQALQEAQEVLEQLDLAIDGGNLPPAAPSTVVDCTQPKPVVWREEEITPMQIEEVCKEIHLSPVSPE